MAQFSVPSSDISQSVQSTTTLSIVDNRVDPPGPPPIDPPIPITSYAIAMSFADEDKYVKAITSNLASAPSGFNIGSTILCNLQGLVDPFIDTGWTLTFVYRVTLTDVPGTSCDLRSGHYLFVSYLSGGSVIVGDIDYSSSIVIDGAWHTLTIDISGFASTLRDEGWFTDPGVKLDWLKDNTPHPTSCIAEYDWQFVQFELPGDGPDIVEITSDAGLEFSGSNFPEFISDAGLDFNFDAEFVFNEILSDAGLEFDCSAVLNLNAYTSDAGLLFDFSPQEPVLSADCSGIYTLIPGQHFDEILSRNTFDSETQDVKIPDPQGKTGFFGG